MRPDNRGFAACWPQQATQKRVLVLQEAWVDIWTWLDGHPVLQTLMASGLLALLAWLLDWLVQRILLRGLQPLLHHYSDYHRDHPA